jgi:hypothetical protein
MLLRSRRIFWALEFGLCHVWINNQLNLAKAIFFYAVSFYTKQGL